ncbi:MAG: serine protease [Planctomycetota bacterium]|nr:MAG: serine protease [Planctomycetota bacterium]RLS98028.1 MAG: serine protease [Planctomycetota bacterium]
MGLARSVRAVMFSKRPVRSGLAVGSIQSFCLLQATLLALLGAQATSMQRGLAQETSQEALQETQGRTRPGSSAGNGPIADLTDGVIDNRRIYNTFVNRGRRLLSSDFPSEGLPENTDSPAGEQIRQMLKRAPNRTPNRMELGLLETSEVEVKPQDLHDRLRRASMMIGTLYDCGRCKNLHGNISGGVIIGEDGLVLTNYHVLDRKPDEKVQGFVAMDFQGRCFAIAEVLAAWESADVVLIRLENTATKFEPVGLASSNPKPLTDVVVMSHPHNEFYVVTTGLASRLTKPTMEGDSNTWLEITAEFSGGSSGSGVFNTQGELVGLVSRIHPMFREQEKSSAARAAGDDRSAGVGQGRDSGAGRQYYPEQILRRCVPIESIHKLLSTR